MAKDKENYTAKVIEKIYAGFGDMVKFIFEEK